MCDLTLQTFSGTVFSNGDFQPWQATKTITFLLTPSTTPHLSQDLPGQCTICTGRHHSDIVAWLTGIGIHILCWWSDTQCPIFSNVETSTRRVCKGRNKWAKRLKSSLTNLWWCKSNSQASCNSHRVEKSNCGAIFRKNHLVLNITASFNTKYNKLPNK